MSQRKYEEIYFPESRFGGFTGADGTIAFYTRINALASGAHTIVDFGCGRGTQQDDAVPFRRQLRNLRGKVTTLIGLDVDPNASSNPFVDQFRLLTSDEWPIESATVDLCFSDCVLEHLSQPDRFFAEARRALRPGGYLCIRTTNAWSYVAAASRLIPNRMHARVLAHVQERRQERDVFPTVYRCNSIPRLKAALARHGFDAVVYGHEAEPSYAAFSGLAYLLAFVYGRVAPSLLRATLFAFARAI